MRTKTTNFIIILRLFFSSGQKWRTNRRILTPSFHDANILENSIDRFNEQLEIGLKIFQKVADKQEDTNLYPLLSAWTLDVLCGKMYESKGSS